MNTKARSLSLSLVLALLLLGSVLALLDSGLNGPPPVLAQGPDGNEVYYVAPDCTGLSVTPCYTMVQQAVDAVDDPADEVWVATGTYTGVNGYGGLSQMVYVSKSLTLRGGYSTTFTIQNPALYTTTLNAQDNGRVLYINGSGITVTVEGLDIWGGYVAEAGGGVYIAQATATISDCFIRWNGYDDWEVYSSKGGGVYVNAGATIRLENNTFYHNWAHYGGGIYIENTSGATLIGNDIDDNRARHDPGRGGGVYAEYSSGITLIDNDIHDNQALPDDFSEGGGVYIRYSDHAVLQDNRFYGNYVEVDQPSNITSLGGGGVYVGDSDHVRVTGNEIHNNTVYGEQSRGWPYGGGALIESSAYLTFTYNLVHHNFADGVINSHGDCGGLALQDVTNGFVAYNEIYANTATDRWGGVVLYGHRFAFIANQVYDNEAQDGNAGGVFLGGGDNSTLRDNEIHHNTVSGTGADYYGGGLYVSGSNNNTLEGNRIYANTSTYAGGGLQVSGSGHTLVANRFFSNTASYGGGIRISADDTLMINNVLAHNEATGLASGDDGSAAAFKAGDTRWYHTTIADNVGPGSALYAFSGGTAAFTNTLIYSQTVGVRNNGGVVTMTQTLWDSVLTRTVGLATPPFGDITGTAAFTADGYHLTATSDALDQGVNAGVTSDIDGQPRPMGGNPDLGADEFAYPADLALGKTGLASGTAGEMLTYTLTVTNAAASQVGTDVRVVDKVEPASAVASLNASAPGDACTAAGPVVTCTLSNVATDTQRTVTVWVTTTAAYDNVLTNTATVTPTDAVDPHGADNVDVVTTTVIYIPSTPDLWVTKGAPAFVEPGAPLVYDLAWGNAGGALATSVTLTDTLPGGVSFQSAAPPPASTNPLVWHLGDLGPGETATATVRVVVGGGLEDGTALVNTTEITTTGTEAAPIDNTDAATTTVYQLGGYDLWLEKMTGSSEVEVGDAIGYALAVTNTGELPADVTLIDAIPAGTEYIAGSASALGGTGSLDDSDGIEWMGTLDVGEDVLVTFGVVVVACEGVNCGTIRNVATAEIDGVSYLWQEQVDTVVRCPDLTISGAGPERSPQFSDGTFKRYDVNFTYQNKDNHAHPGVAHTTTVTLTLPEGAQFSASNPVADETSPDKRTKIWHLGDLSAGANGTIQVQVEPHQWIDNGTTVTANIASQPGVECDPNADNQDTVTTHPTKMELEKQAGNPRWVITTDPVTGDPIHRLWVDYYLRYHYQTSDPARPPVSSYRIDDQWPGSLDLERHTSEPDLDTVMIGSRAAAADGTVTPLRFEGTEYLRVDDPGWLRLQGSTTTVITPGHVIVNEAEQTYEAQKTQGTGTEAYTDSARVEFEVPLSPPYISSPQVGSTCAGDSLQVRGQTPAGDQVRVYLEDSSHHIIQVVDTPVDSRAWFTATVNIPAASEFRYYHLYAKAVEGSEESLSSEYIRLMTPSGGGWCPQRSYWEGTLKAGPNQGQHRTYFFRNEVGELSSLRWQIPGEYGFWDTRLHLYSCCTEPTQAMTVTADGTVHAPNSRDGHWYHFDITGGAHDVTIASQCGDQVVGESGEILIDPDGFVFDVDQGGGHDPVTGMFDPVAPVSGVTVTCMMSAPQWGGWVPWPAHLYDQVNPQVTDAAYADGITTTGYFAFFTPPGHYYLDVEGIPDYQAWRSPVVEVITQIVHVNVPYTPWPEDVAATVDLTPGGSVSDVITIPVGSAVEWRSTMRATDTLTDLVAWTENPILHARSDLDPLLEPRGFDAGYLAPGRVYRRAFADPGVYTYTVRGQAARVVVEQPRLYLPLVLRQ